MPISLQRTRTFWLSAISLCLLLMISTTLTAKETEKEAQAQINPDQLPRYIAVLPAYGKGKEAEQNDMRLAIHNTLGTSHYELVKPSDIDRHLKALVMGKIKSHKDIAPKELATKLRVDGLIYVNLATLEKIYAAAYAHYKIAIEVELYSLKEDRIIWRYSDKETEREGGISADPLSFLVTAISSSRVLTDAVRLQLTDTLARRFANEIPQPKQLIAKAEPLKIISALSNAVDGPFKAGEEIRVLVKAERGLNIHFLFSHSKTTFPLSESKKISDSASEYTGRYVVTPRDNVSNASIKLSIQRNREAPIDWHVPGTITMDTRKPKGVSQLTALAQAEQVALSWQSPNSGRDKLLFHVERAEKGAGKFKILGSLDLLEFNDTTLNPGSSYTYRVTAEDPSGNRSNTQSIDIETVRYGPTEIESDIRQSTVFKAAGSPYRLKGHIRILKGVSVTFEAGSVIEFLPDATLEVLGQLNANGKSTSPIVFRGDNWTLKHDFSPNPSTYSHSRFQGSLFQDKRSQGGQANNSKGTITVESTSVTMSDCSLSNSSVKIHQAGVLNMSRCHSRDNTIAVHNLDGKLTLSDSTFQNNQQALYSLTDNTTLKNTRFMDNQAHIISQRPMSLSSVYFPSDDFISLKQRLSGPININWQTYADSDNLQRQWLVDIWLQTTEAIQQQQWSQARNHLQPAAETLNDNRINDLLESLYILQNPMAQAADVTEAKLLPHLLELRKQQQRANLVWLPSQTVEQYQSFTLAYLNHYYGKLLADGILQIAPDSLESSVLSQKVLGIEVDRDLGIIYLVNDTLLQQQLTSVGVIRHPPLLDDFYIVKPSHPQLCQSKGPWALGEETVNNDNPLQSPGCLSLRIHSQYDNTLFLFGLNDQGLLTQLLPDNCHSAGLLSNQLLANSTIAVPLNKNQQPAVALLSDWDFSHYYAVAMTSATEREYIQPLLDIAVSHCDDTKTSSRELSPTNLQQQLHIADKRSGGRVQWLTTQALSQGKDL